MKKEILLCPSMMLADYGQLKKEVIELDEAGADIFHCDIMDGSFVPNMTMGIMDVMAIRKYTKKPIDCHLMMENPENKVDWFIDAGANIIYIHPESERYVIKTLAHIKERGCKAGIAINPDTSIETIYEVLNLCDYVKVMTVNPGFAGQKFIEFTKEKIKKLVKLKEKYGFKIMIDGSCSPEIIKELSLIGADGFILGTSALFGKKESYAVLIDNLRNM
ncbi:MAG: ribulose-phosphate 3-epimerase [Erysipelotrichaceae bacterium]|nr:ribulose-phosphate 3-epimerase [Erysipelotrichaceae bacterium]